MFASRVSLADFVCNQEACVSKEVLLRALRGASAGCFGREALLHLASCAGAAAEQLLVASLLSEFQEGGAELASALLLLCDASSPARDLAVAHLARLLQQQHAPALPFFVPLLAAAPALGAHSAQSLAQLAAFYFQTAQHELLAPVLGLIRQFELQLPLADALLDRSLLVDFARLHHDDDADDDWICGLTQMLRDDNRGKGAHFVTAHVYSLLALNKDHTLKLLCMIPHGRRMMLNLIMNNEQSFREAGHIRMSAFCNWIELIAAAIRTISKRASKSEDVLVTSYLARYLPLFDHIISSHTFDRATVQASLSAMIAMNNCAGKYSTHTRETERFMLEHQPELARQMLEHLEQ
jgi:hypothetical protein